MSSKTPYSGIKRDLSRKSETPERDPSLSRDEGGGEGGVRQGVGIAHSVGSAVLGVFGYRDMATLRAIGEAEQRAVTGAYDKAREESSDSSEEE